MVSYAMGTDQSLPSHLEAANAQGSRTLSHPYSDAYLSSGRICLAWASGMAVLDPFSARMSGPAPAPTAVCCSWTSVFDGFTVMSRGVLGWDLFQGLTYCSLKYCFC